MPRDHAKPERGLKDVFSGEPRANRFFLWPASAGRVSFAPVFFANSLDLH